MGENEKVKAYILLSLHAHLPFVRTPEKKFSFQELWLFQAITECYIPLLKTIKELAGEGTDFNLTLSLSPTLLTMLNDDYYKKGYSVYLNTLQKIIHPITKEKDEATRDAASWLAEKISQINSYNKKIKGNLIDDFAGLSSDRRINIITSAATHSVLPLYRFSSEFIEKQVSTGLRVFKNLFGYSPQGFWLPELAYCANLDKILGEAEIKYTFLDSHSIYLSKDKTRSGNFYPSVTKNGMTIFPRELSLSNMIWSAHAGYPGDFRYREFHFDYTYSLADKDLSRAGIEKMPFGLKIYRITGNDDRKQFYERDSAMIAVNEHSADFVKKLGERADQVRKKIGRTPVFTLPFDAELFGHWWHEGPEFLKNVIKEISNSEEFRMVSPDDLAGKADLEVITPAESSWGDEGFFKVWLNPECSWVYPKFAGLYNRMLLASDEPKNRKALSTAYRELLLASSSDWIFFIANNTFKDYGNIRIRDHLDAAERIIESVENGNTDEEFLQQRKKQYPIFGDINML